MKMGAEPPEKNDMTSREKISCFSKERNRKKCVPCCYISKRYIIVALLSFGMFIVHAMRVNIAVTVVTILDEAAYEKVAVDSINSKLPTVEWTSKMVGLLHSVFYMGYLVTQIPGGYLATILPSHRMFGGVILCSGAFNLLLPVVIARDIYGGTCAVRVVQGLFEGMLYPTCYAVMGHWTIPDERSRMGAIVLTGVYLGPVVGLAVSGSITHYISWEYVYYIHGFGCIIWFVLWLFLSYESPTDHPHISNRELEIIEKSQGLSPVMHKDEKIPWQKIFTSMPVYSLAVCNFARNWVFYLMLTNEPMYINMFGFSLAENGVFSAIPHLMMAVVAISSGPLADLMVQDVMLSRTDVRKMFTGIGFGAEAACMLILGFTVSGVPALVYLSIGLGISGLTVSGWQINHLDLAPRYAGVLVAITTAVGTIAGILIPVITGYLTQDMTIEGWQHVFYLTAVILTIAIVFYSLFGSGEMQIWADPRPTMKIVHKHDPFDGSTKPYGTFPAQMGSDENISEQDLSRPAANERISASDGLLDQESIPNDADNSNKSDLSYRDLGTSVQGGEKSM